MKFRLKKYNFRRLTRKRLSKQLLIIAGSVVVLLIASSILVQRIYKNNLLAVTPINGSVVEFNVKSGATLEEIARNLETAKLIRSDWAFKQYVRGQGLTDKIKAGTYRLSSAQDVRTIVEYLVEGRVQVNLFTIYPAQRLDQIRQAFREDGFSEDDINEALNPETFAGHPALVDRPKGASLEGFLYPDSYERVAETKPRTIVGQALDEMAEALSPEIRAGIARQGLSVYQGIILASIVEKEVSSENPDEKPQVAQVFLKRLRQDMALESDATTLYGAAIEGKLKGLTHAQAVEKYHNYESSYNSYNHKGLTPTPISNVNRSSLQAVASPATTDYLYFVSGDDCVTRFSRTFAEHEQNIAKYLKKGCGN